jgi:hypothetical protein
VVSRVGASFSQPIAIIATIQQVNNRPQAAGRRSQRNDGRRELISISNAVNGRSNVKRLNPLVTTLGSQFQTGQEHEGSRN